MSRAAKLRGMSQMNIPALSRPFIGVILLVASVAQAQDSETVKKQNATAPQAKVLIDRVKAKLMAIDSLVVDFDLDSSLGTNFTRDGEMFLQRPNKFRV